MANSKKYSVVGIMEHIKTKSMWAGSIEVVLCNLYGLKDIMDQKLICAIKSKHSPALLKAFDEIIVNAADHVNECLNSNNKVTSIEITYNEKTGFFSCFNNGKSIPIEKNEEISRQKGRDVYIPEILSCIPLSGDNIEEDKKSIKGGTNGIGLKIANIRSKEFRLITSNGKQRYTLNTRLNMSKIIKPTIVDLKNIEPSYTLIEMMPDYESCGYTNLKTSYDEIHSWLYMRAYQLALYVSAFDEDIGVLFNDIHCDVDPIGFMKLLCDRPGFDFIYKMTPVEKKNKNKLNVCIRVAKRKNPDLSIINGIVCKNGKHMNIIKTKIINEVNKKILSMNIDIKIQKAVILDNITILVWGAIPNIQWTGQRKDMYDIDSMDYTFDKNMSDMINLLFDLILPKINKKPKVKYELTKYTPAENVKTTKSKLFICEGDSALACIKQGLNSKKTNKEVDDISYRYCGTYSVGGVILNALKQVTEHTDSEGKIHIIRNEKLDKNIVLNELNSIIGLNFEKTYTKEDIRKFNYAELICCVDQDLDGCGKILSLILTYIHTFWPELIEFDYVKQFITPVIRVYNKKTLIKEFYYENDFFNWNDMESSYNVKFYKGLASHDNNEINIMYNNFYNNLYTFRLDKLAKTYFNIYFGADVVQRKQELASPVDEKLRNYDDSILCTNHLRYTTKMFKQEAINRQIPNCIDGLTIAKRKVLAACIKKSATSSGESKVIQICGYTTDNMQYHHGDASLNSTIIKMAANYIGAKKLPLLTGHGQFGSRYGGHQEAGGARYITVSLSTGLVKHLFPHDDLCCLDYMFEDGQRVEPINYVPIIPYSILESNNNPSEGWVHKSWARRVDQTLQILKAQLTNDPFVTDCMHKSNWLNLQRKYPLDVCTKENIGRIVYHDDKVYSIGVCNYDANKNMFIVTELPLKILIKSYLETMTKNKKRQPHIKKITNRSTNDSVYIMIELNADAYNNITKGFKSDVCTQIEEFCLIRLRLVNMLNYTTAQRCVIEFTNYYDIIKYWFNTRKELYYNRINKKKVITECKLKLELEIVRFIDIHNKLKLKDESEETVVNVLINNNFAVLNTAALTGCVYTPVADINDKFTLTGSYNYVLNLKTRDMLIDNKQKRIELCDKYRGEIEYYNNLLLEQPIPCSSLWLEEIKHLEKYVL